MTQTFVVEAEVRADQGKGASRRLRREGKVPAVLYGGNEAAQAISLSHNELMKQLKVEAFYSHILTVKVGSADVQAVLKDLQRHPVRDEVLHADFQRVLANQLLRKRVPLHFENEAASPGVKLGGGMVEHFLNEVEVECYPADLPEYIAVDLAKIELGQVVHLSQITLPKGVTLIELKHGNDAAIVSCHLTKAAKGDEEATPAEEEAKKEEPKK